MVVDDLDIKGIAIFPLETDPPLPIDADAVLSGPVTVQRLKVVAGRHTKVIECPGTMHQ